MYNESDSCFSVPVSLQLHLTPMNFKAKSCNSLNYGVEWYPQGQPESVNAYDFLTDADGIAINNR